MSSFVLECEHLVAGYHGIPVVHDVSLELQPGEIVGLLGPNGAGKTTLLMALAGVLPLLGGCARIDGRLVEGGNPHLQAKRGLSYVPDDRALLSTLTVVENLRLAGAGSRSRDAQDAYTVAEVLEIFPALAEKLPLAAGLLSGGEQQMLAIAKSVIRRPRVLLIDEMSLGLAPRIVASLMPIIQGLARENGTAVLLVEQHAHALLKLVDRVYVMRRGRVVANQGAEHFVDNIDELERHYLG